MQDREALNPALQEVRDALGRLQPTRRGLNRDQLMFNAGRASARSHRPWQAACGVLTVALLCTLLLVRPPETEAGGHPSQTSVLAVYDPTDSDTDRHPNADASGMTYLQLRRQVLLQGLDALPHDSGGRGGKLNVMNRGQWLRSVL